MSITLTHQPATTTIKIDHITIQLFRDHTEVSATISFFDSDGKIVTQETIEHPNPNQLVLQLIPDPVAFFDRIDTLLTVKYPGTTTSNDDVVIS